MKPLRVHYKNEEMRALYLHCHTASGSFEKGVDDTGALLMCCCLKALSERLAKRLIGQKDEYQFTFRQEDQLAFFMAYEAGWIYSRNIWTANILKGLYEQVHQQIA